MIKACVFAYAGVENRDFIREQVQKALEGFEFVLGINNIEDIYDVYKDKLVFKNGAKWPSIYHLRLLAYTFDWRSELSLSVVVNSIKRLIELSPPPVKFLHKRQIISPASLLTDIFLTDINEISDKDWMVWFQRTELVSRLGVALDIPEIRKQIMQLHEQITGNNGMFPKIVAPHYYFTKWMPYLGLAL